MKVMNENLLATGDDDGCVKVNVVQVKRISAQICLGGSKLRRNLYSRDTLGNKEIVVWKEVSREWRLGWELLKK